MANTPSLYALTDELRATADRLYDLDLPQEVIADTLESMSGALEEKAQSVAMFVRNLESTVDAINAFTKSQQQRAKSMELRAESLRGYLARCMEATGIEKIEGPGVKLSFRKSSAVMIDGADLIPAEFMRTPEPPPPAPDKKLIAEAIKAGREVPGAHIEVRRSLQIA